MTLATSNSRGVAVIGAGIIGARITRELLGADAGPFARPDGVTLVTRRSDRARLLEGSFGGAVRVIHAGSGEVELADSIGTVILARGSGEQLNLAGLHLSQGRNVVATTDDLEEVESLLALDAAAESSECSLVIGAAMSPGFSCLLAAHASELFDKVDEIHVARVGAAGPACARQRLKALRGTAIDWRDGDWVRRPGFSGRDLLWFPDPIGARDCYRAALPEPLLLVPAIEGLDRVTARISANRRDRALAPFPVLLPPPVEGGLGAIRVEVRGRRGEERHTAVYGALDRPAAAAGSVAALVGLWLRNGVAPLGAYGVAGLGATSDILRELARRGVRAATFVGSGAEGR